VGKKTIQSLDLLNCTNSGLEALLEQTNSDLNYNRFFVKLTSEKYEELQLEFENHPELINTPKIKALFLLNLILQGKKINHQHISMRPAQEFIVDILSYELIELFKELEAKKDILEINFYQYLDIMPSLVIYFSDYLLKDFHWKNRNNPESLSSVRERVWRYLNDDTCWKFMNQDLNSQRYRLQALYHRRLIDKASAEEALVKYRESFKPDLQGKIKINEIDISHIFPADQVFDNIENVYNEITTIQSEILARSGVDADSCFYYSCNDCCTKDFPTVSLLEFLYIKQWLSANNIDIKPFVDKALQIQSQHQETFGEPLKIVDQTLSKAQDENPFGFQFSCPFLSSENVCQIHHARPLVCRSFGLSSINHISVQACKYFLTQYQYNASHRNERDVFTAVTTTHMFGSANELLAQKYDLNQMKQPVATLVAWLDYFSS
jgi:Fe-S-cluster containining protein